MSLVYPLLFGLFCFMVISWRRGHDLKSLGFMAVEGAKKSYLVLQIFVLIGIITALWRACGTVSFIVYYGISLMHPHYFIISAFLLCCLMSFLLGTCFGTVGTIGIILIVLAKSGNVDINIAAGAIIAGAFFGDRCSPMSSSANLVAVLTSTQLYINVRNMLRTSIGAFALASVGYVILSYLNPLVFMNDQMKFEIMRLFNLHPSVVLPAAIILIAAVFKIDVKISMSISIVAAFVLAILLQGKTVAQLLEYIMTGYHTEAPGAFAGMIQGGGLYSMLNVSLIILISSAYSGIFEGTGLLREVERFLETVSKKAGVYFGTVFTSITSAAFACNQVFGVMLTYYFQKKIYEKKGLDKYRLALDLENTIIVLSVLIPWNIAGAFPATLLSADAGFIPYAFYLYLLPLMNWRRKISDT